MIKKKFISDHDIQLFQEALKNGCLLKQKHPKLGTPSFSQKSSYTSDSTSSPYFTDITHTPCVKPEETLFFVRTGLQRKQIQKLKKGQIPIAASIDLHGMHFDEAFGALETFFFQCLGLGSPQRCFCIIHGKGQGTPILKNLVNRFLKQQNQVLAFCSAPPSLGGAGATLVLIKSTLQGPFI